MQEAFTLAFALAILYPLFIVESLLALFAIRTSRTNPGWGRLWFASAERWLGRLAARRGHAVLAVGVLALASRAALSPFLPVHQPVVTDEFSYLLAGDTFAAGHLTNPTHPMWKHFETIHVLEQPTYMSMYLPAQGLILAAGMRLTGHAWIGIYLSAGLMCAAICWMLQGWLPPRWALLGGVLAVVRLGLFGYWMNSYWGGAPAAIGGALVLGALPRMMGNLRLRYTLLMGAGAAVLAVSRPYEGGAMCLAVGGIVLAWMFGKSRPPIFSSFTRVLLPMMFMLALTTLGIGYYFYRVTGNPFHLPEMAQREPYALAPIFLWQSAGVEPVYRHKALHDFYAVWEMKEVLPEIRSAGGLISNALKKLIGAWLFFLGPALTVPLLFLPRIVKYDRRMRRLILIGGVSLIALELDAWFYPHYAAPITAIVFAMVVQGLRHLRVWRRRTGEGLLLSRAMPAICIAMIAVRLAAQPLGFLSPPAWPMTWYHTPEGNVARARILGSLSAMKGDQLAIVRYRADHNAVMNEWVYNRADIDGSKVVWARDMSPADNLELLQYFHERRAWLVEADETPPRLSPYPLEP
jgi:hypothetical protein